MHQVCRESTRETLNSILRKKFITVHDKDLKALMRKVPLNKGEDHRRWRQNSDFLGKNNYLRSSFLPQTSLTGKRLKQESQYAHVFTDRMRKDGLSPHSPVY